MLTHETDRSLKRVAVMFMTFGFLFDIDGTLIDSVDLHAQAWKEALAHFGFDVPYQRVRSQIGKGGDQLLPVFVPADQLDRLKDEIEEYRGQLFKRQYLSRIRAFPRVRDLFERIRGDGHRIALASSAASDEIANYKKIANIDGLTDVDTSRGDVDCSKPCPDVFEVARARLGIESGHALVFGDSPFDAMAAKSAGLRSVGVLCGGFPEEQLREAGCMAIYAGPSDLLDRYEQVLGLFTRVPQTP